MPNHLNGLITFFLVKQLDLMNIDFTIITATYNSEKTIKRTLNSVLNQTYNKSFEYIVIDGNSKDKTIELVKNYEPKFKERNIFFKWISEPDSGIYDAWNKGLKLATGNWISFLGSDDYYVDDALNNYSLLLNKDYSYDWVYSNVNYIENEKKFKILNSTWSWKNFRRNVTITPAHVGSFHNYAYFKRYGTFDESYKIAGDYELLLRAKDKLKTAKINKTTAIMSAGGISNKQVSVAFKETFKAKLKTGEVNLLLCCFDYCYSYCILLYKISVNYFK